MRKELDILVIEDVPRDAEAIEQELRDAALPFKTRRVETRPEFLAELHKATPDIVLSDFTLPEFDALAALRTLQKLKLDIPFILVTGTRSEEVAVECLHEGADDYILKASLTRLPSSILGALRKKSAEREKARAVAELRRSEEQFRVLTENTHDLVGLLDVDGKFLYASPSFQTALGYPPLELIGTEAVALVHPDDRPALRRAWQRALVHRRAQPAEFRARHRAGDWRVFEAMGTWVFDEKNFPQRTVVVCRDITRRKQEEEMLRSLPRLIRDAQESERHRVARELHDSVNQILSSVKFRLSSVEEKLADRDEAVRREALKAKEFLEKAIQEVRRISRNLRPSELDDLGLVPALRSLGQEFGERTRMRVDLAAASLPAPLPPEIELNLYRIVQEALNNIEKHSRATLVSISLAREGALLKAVILDDGDGFDPRQPRRPGPKGTGMGLVDMKERAAFVGGQCVFHSTPGRGTEISITIPLPHAPKAKAREKRTAEKGKVEKDQTAAGR